MSSSCTPTAELHLPYLQGYPPELLVQVREVIQAGRVQGSRLKVKREICIASPFKQAPANFLRMIVSRWFQSQILL